MKKRKIKRCDNCGVSDVLGIRDKVFRPDQLLLNQKYLEFCDICKHSYGAQESILNYRNVTDVEKTEASIIATLAKIHWDNEVKGLGK